MKDNYSTQQEAEFIRLAQRWKVSPDEIRQRLDELYDANFYQDIESIDEFYSEKYAKYVEYATDFQDEIDLDE